MRREPTFHLIASSPLLAGDGFPSRMKRGVAMMCMPLAQHRGEVITTVGAIKSRKGHTMRRSVFQSLQLRESAVGCFALLILAMSAEACELATTVRSATLEDIKTFFGGEQKAVVTFVGYSGADYEDKTTMLQTAENILAEFDPAKTIINIGATQVGIGAVYAVAKRKGFLTTGIVSALAKEYQVELSACVDYVFYVPDTAWGGFIEGSQGCPRPRQRWWRTVTR